MKMNLSDEVIAGLEPRCNGYYVYDASVPGLSVEVMPSGTKTLYEQYGSYKYRFKKNIRLGEIGETTYKEASKKAIEVRAKLKVCKDKVEADQVAQKYKLEKRKTRMSEIDSVRNRLSAQIRESALPRPHINMPFQDGSELRHDFAWPELWVALNISCGNTKQHRYKAMSLILNKHNPARALGWSAYLVSRAMVNNGSAIELISRAVKGAIKKQEGVLGNEY